ncbi:MULTISPECIES: cell division protein SepF [Corynebacterium]|nr:MULTISPECIES: cell division protein SepF [Corynebacterium]ESU57871.1 cell division protein SepF [Corynebacterium ulcerans NCTC 12077]STC83955.1 Cell division protein sepF [Corynebacterium ulcerans]
MSIMKKTKDFFGLSGVEGDPYLADEAYYEEPRYEGNAAYQPQRYREPAYQDVHAYDHVSRRASSNIVPVTINSYSDAATKIGEPFRDGDSVVFDINRLGLDEGKRIVDFAAGLCFALRGQMKKISHMVFAIVPESADVTTADLERAARV